MPEGQATQVLPLVLEEKVPGAQAAHTASEDSVQAAAMARLTEEQSVHAAQGWRPDELQVKPATHGSACTHAELNQ